MAYELKTKKNKASVSEFLNSVENETRRSDAKQINKMMKEITGKSPKMWGASIVGFDSYKYKSKSGIEGEWMMIGYSPRKQNLSLYIMSGLDTSKDLLKKLGKHKKGVGCLYINKLEDVDISVLKKLIKKSYSEAKKGNKVC